MSFDEAFILKRKQIIGKMKEINQTINELNHKSGKLLDELLELDSEVVEQL